MRSADYVRSNSRSSIGVFRAYFVYFMILYLL